MKRKIRVLVVDDSVIIRRLLTDMLSEDAEIEVVGQARNGRDGLAKIAELRPDLVTLDIEMPELDGLAMLPLLRKDHPKLPVIMFSTLTDRGAAATLTALTRGATDYVGKPSNKGSLGASIQSVKEQLIPKIKAFCAPPKPAVAKPVARPQPARPSTQRPSVVVIGSSTGGPQALETVLTGLPAHFPLPILIVQHMPPVFTNQLASRLNDLCELEVAEAAGGELIQSGQVLIAPGDFHMEVCRKGASVVASVHQGPAEDACRPAVNVLFRSAAQVFGGGCFGVVLTGMGQDGLRGGEEIVQAGGMMLAQDKPTSVVWGMPRAISEAGLAYTTLPLQSIAAELVRRSNLSRPTAVLS